MKEIVICDSQYGFTEKYARWIAEECGCDCISRNQIKPGQLSAYHRVIYGGGLYAGGVSGLKWFAKQLPALSGRKIALFTCGLADPSDPANTAHIRAEMAKILSPEQMQLPIFHFRGGIDYARLSFVHKCMMEMMYRVMKKKFAESGKEEDRIFLETYGKAVDYTDRAAIQPLADWMNQ